MVVQSHYSPLHLSSRFLHLLKFPVVSKNHIPCLLECKPFLISSLVLRILSFLDNEGFLHSCMNKMTSINLLFLMEYREVISTSIVCKSPPSCVDSFVIFRMLFT